MGGTFLAHRGLVVVACSVAMAEAGLLVAFAPAARALAPQVTALLPLAVFHDLRWLQASQYPWLGFGLLLAGLLLARSALNTALIRLAWPAGSPPPAFASAVRAALGVTAFATLLMSPLVSVTLGVAILPFSWPFLAMLPALLVIAIPLSHAGVAGTWWRTLPPAAAVGWLLTEFVVLSLAAAVTAVLPVAAAVPVAGLAGLVNARAWYGVTGAVCRPRVRSRLPVSWLLGTLAWPVYILPLPPQPAPRAAGGTRAAARRVPAAPLALATAIALLIAVTRIVFVLAMPSFGHLNSASATAFAPGPGLPPAGALEPGKRHPVLEIFGFGSTCCAADPALASAMPGTWVSVFSYRGMTRSGVLLPYGPSASNLPLPLLGDRIAAQVWRLYKRTGRLVDVVAESEGTLGVDAMFARHPDVPVGSVALLSPIVAPGQARYREAAGSGVVTGDELNAVIWFIGGLSPFGTSGAQKLIDSVNNVGARFAAQASDSPRRLMEVIPLADAVTLPACPLPANVVVVPAFHGQLLGDPAALRLVARFLAHRPVGGVPGLRHTAEIMAAAASAWRMPVRQTPSPPCVP